MSISAQLAKLTLAEDMNDAATAYAAAKRLMLDTIGVAAAGADAPGLQALLDLQTSLGGKPQATVLFHGLRLPLPDAAFINSVMIHALDYDDVHSAANLHIMSTVFPSALGCGEFADRDGQQLLEAVILGIEVAARIGRPRKYSKVGHNCFLPSSMIGGFGATAAAARLMGLTEEETVNAFGIFYAHSSGNRQALVERKLTKRMQPAIAAKAAVYSALAAKHGITGPKHVFEGKCGLYRLLAVEPPPESHFGGMPLTFEVENVSVKEYPTCGGQHAAIRAALMLHQRHRFRYQEIEAVDLFLGTGDSLVGMPFRIDSDPQADAQFCAPYAVALALVRGDVSVTRFSNESIRSDKRVIELAGKMNIIERWDWSRAAFPLVEGMGEWACSPQLVRVRMTNGEALEQACTPHEVKESFRTFEAVIGKFRDCSEHAAEMSAPRTDAIIDQVRHFEDVQSVRSFAEEHLGRLK